MIPLSKVYVDSEMKKAVSDVLDSGYFIHGEKIKEFESKFSNFISSNFALGVSSGTAAIRLALDALDVKAGDEILVPSHTAFPTVEPILQLDAEPKFIDIEPDIYNIDPKMIGDKITLKTKGIIAVHLYGHPADLDPIKEIADEHNLFLIEDCAQAPGSEYKKRQVGSIGTIGCFSFYPSKNMTVCGDGGMVTTNHRELYDKIKLLRNHGMEDKYNHLLVGHNFRLGEIQAAIGIKQLEKLKWFNERRREIGELYTEHLADLPVILPVEREWAYHVYHLYVVRVTQRDKVIQYLNQHGIVCGIHYPIPVHLQPSVPIHLRERLPITERCVNQILSLPIYPLLKDGDIQYISTELHNAIKNLFL
jgi:dTDP-4-amino-4,6-dideoxygalactose transaminase